jgi:hypothetical protein
MLVLTVGLFILLLGRGRPAPEPTSTFVAVAVAPTVTPTNAPPDTPVPVLPTNTPLPLIPTDAPSPTPTPMPTDTPLPATDTPTATPAPTDTPTPTATATSTPILLGQNCSSNPGGTFINLWQDYRQLLGCPVTGQQTIPTMAEEIFQAGHMFWRSDTDVIYVIYDRQKDGAELFEGKWQTDPTWKWDGSNPDGIGLYPPPGLYEPKRGFGWLWRTHLGGADGPLGWALDKEYGFDNTGQVQAFEQGIMFKGSSPKLYVLLNNGGFFAR